MVGVVSILPWWACGWLSGFGFFGFVGLCIDSGLRFWGGFGFVCWLIVIFGFLVLGGLGVVLACFGFVCFTRFCVGWCGIDITLSGRVLCGVDLGVGGWC